MWPHRSRRPLPYALWRFMSRTSIMLRACGMQASCSDTKCLPRLKLSPENSPSILPCIQHRRPSQPRSARFCRAQAVHALSVDTPLIAALRSRAEADQAAFHVPGHKVYMAGASRLQPLNPLSRQH